MQGPPSARLSVELPAENWERRWTAGEIWLRKERCKIDYIHRSRRRDMYMLEHGGMRPMMPTEA